MLVNATFLPDTALLVPGAAGAREVLPDVRAAALDAVRTVVAGAPAGVVVVTPGTSDRTRTGPFAPTLSAVGIDDAGLGWAVPVAPPQGELPQPERGQVGGAGAGRGPAAVDGPAAAVVLLLLARAGWSGPTTLVEVRPPGPDPGTRASGRAADLAALGSAVAGGPDPVAVLAAGSLSARRGPAAPLAEDGRAAALDGAMVADLRGGDPRARARLAATSPDLAADLAVTAWAPWQVLLGGVPAHAAVRTHVPVVTAPFGVTYVVASWWPS